MDTKKLKREYDKAFKENAVKLSYERDNIRVLAEELGITPDILYRWRNEYAEFDHQSFAGKGHLRLSEEQKKVRKLEKDLKNKDLEIEILKKALSIISKSDL